MMVGDSDPAPGWRSQQAIMKWKELGCSFWSLMNKLWVLIKGTSLPKGGQTAVQAVLYYIQGSILTDPREKSFQQMAAKCCILIKSEYHDIL